MQIKIIPHNSPEYIQMITLRLELLRLPLGLSFTRTDLDNEKKDILVTVINKNEMIGCCVLTQHDKATLQLRQMAVREKDQLKGIGKMIVEFAEKTALENGYKVLMMHARNTAMKFYQKCGFEIKGQEFTEVGIPHHYMEKRL